MWGNVMTVRRSSARSSGVPWYIQTGICMPRQLVITHCRAKMLTFGANRLNSSIQLYKTLRGQTTRKGASTRTRRYAINAKVWMVCKKGQCKRCLQVEASLLYVPYPDPSHRLHSPDSIKYLTMNNRRNDSPKIPEMPSSDRLTIQATPSS